MAPLRPVPVVGPAAPVEPAAARVPVRALRVPPGARLLGTAFRRSLARDPVDVAPELIGLVLVTAVGAGRIVEVEAYRGEDDDASHARMGKTRRNSVMFGPPGGLYVYFTYGMHFCCNVVCWSAGSAGAVLIRALEPLTGCDEMRQRRGAAARRERDLCSGPGKLCQALGIDGSFNGADLLGDGPVRLGRLPARGRLPAPTIASSRRIGLAPALESAGHAWRFVDTASVCLSNAQAVRPVV